MVISAVSSMKQDSVSVTVVSTVIIKAATDGRYTAAQTDDFIDVVDLRADCPAAA